MGYLVASGLEACCFLDQRGSVLCMFNRESACRTILSQSDHRQLCLSDSFHGQYEGILAVILMCQPELSCVTVCHKLGHDHWTAPHAAWDFLAMVVSTYYAVAT